MGRKIKTESGKIIIAKQLPLCTQRVGKFYIVISWQYSHYCLTCGERVGGLCNTAFQKFCYKCGEKLRWNLDGEPGITKKE